MMNPSRRPFARILAAAILSLPLSGWAQSLSPVSISVAPVSAAAVDTGWLPNFNHTPETMNQQFSDAKSRLLGALDSVVAVPANERTFENTVKRVETAYANYYESLLPVTFLSQVSADPRLRAAATELDKQSSAFGIELSAREDVYRAFKEFSDGPGKSLDGVDKKLLNDYMTGFRRSGMELTSEQRARLNDLQKRISELVLDFDNNVNGDNTSVILTKDQLEGVPADFIKELKSAGNGRVEMTLDYPHYSVFMENAKNPALRQMVEAKFNNKSADKNLPILDEVLAKRNELAKLLGYANYAEYALDYKRMAKTPKTVLDFLRKLKNVLAGPAKAEQAELLEIKKKEQPTADQIYNWDVTSLVGQQLGYTLTQLIKQKYDFDPEEVRQYFPVNRVVAQTLQLYQELFGVTFKELPAQSPAPDLSGKATSWHPEVRLFEVHNKDSDAPIAYFYLDLYPREGKYNHMAAFDLQVGRQLADGTYRRPVAAMVGNFTKATADKPALMSIDEVETFFHEFGHIMHQTLTKGKYATFAGSNVDRDFVEAPSQMLENFVWKTEILNRVSGHYRDESKKLPADLLNKMLAAKNADSALGTLRLVALSALDMAYHTAVPENTTELMKRIFAEVGYLAPTPGTHFQARFGHPMSGYDAGYYTYPWSRRFGVAMFRRFDEEGVTNPKVGMDYRRFILEPGGEQTPMEEMTNFLGHAPDDEAYFKSLGLPAPANN